MLGASLRHGGDELLGRTDNLERYASEGSTLGIPLLHPWANRLAAPGYEVAGRRVELDPASRLLHLDDNGLPIHGIVGAALPWTVVRQSAGPESAEVVAELDPRTPELLDVFPFRHRLEQRVVLDPARPDGRDHARGRGDGSRSGVVRLPPLPRRSRAWSARTGTSSSLR